MQIKCMHNFCIYTSGIFIFVYFTCDFVIVRYIAIRNGYHLGVKRARSNNFTYTPAPLQHVTFKASFHLSSIRNLNIFATKRILFPSYLSSYAICQNRSFYLLKCAGHCEVFVLLNTFAGQADGSRSQIGTYSLYLVYVGLASIHQSTK